MRQVIKDLELCEKAKETCNKDDGVRYAALARYWIKRAVEGEMLLKEVLNCMAREEVPTKPIFDAIKEFLGGGEG